MPECAEEFKARILKPLQGLLDQIQGVQQHLSQEPQVHPLQTRRPEQHAGSSSYKSCNNPQPYLSHQTLLQQSYPSNTTMITYLYPI